MTGLQKILNQAAEGSPAITEWATNEEERRFELATKETRDDLERWFSKRANEDKFEHAAFALVWFAYHVLCNFDAYPPEDLAELYGIKNGVELSPTAVKHIVGYINNLSAFNIKDGELTVVVGDRGADVEELEGEVNVEVRNASDAKPTILVTAFPEAWKVLPGVYVRGPILTDSYVDQFELRVSLTDVDGFTWCDWETCPVGPGVIVHPSTVSLKPREKCCRKIIWDDDAGCFVILLP